MKNNIKNVAFCGLLDENGQAKKTTKKERDDFAKEMSKATGKDVQFCDSNIIPETMNALAGLLK